ncbi:hypothetical protein HDU79_004540 [Rhizoclosmatium sp. JEL0117]|nr:hypothetical protein HDU79_004540 [Rhizoclosmatium sp. JEL0117]
MTSIATATSVIPSRIQNTTSVTSFVPQRPWSYGTASMQLKNATTPAQVVATLIEASTHLPACSVGCMMSSAPQTYLSLEFFESICANHDLVIPTLGQCITVACIESDVKIAVSVLQVTPVGCVQFQNIAAGVQSAKTNIKNSALTKNGSLFSLLALYLLTYILLLDEGAVFDSNHNVFNTRPKIISKMKLAILAFAATALAAPVSDAPRCPYDAETKSITPCPAGYFCASGFCMELAPPGKLGDLCNQFSVNPTICGAGLTCVAPPEYPKKWFNCQPSA